MAKTKVKQTRAAPRARAHSDPERWTRLLIVGGVAAVVAIAIGFIVFGYWDSQIRPKGKTVLRVNDTEVSLGHLERRMELFQDRNPAYATPGQHLLQLPDLVLDEIEREVLLIEGAAEIDVAATDEEVDAEIRDRGGLEDDAEPSEFAREFRSQVDESGLTAGEYRQMVTADVIEAKVLDYFAFLAPDTESQAHARWILLNDQASADSAYAQLEEGADFEELAREVSTDTTAEEGGLLDWRTRGAFPSLEMDRFLFEEAEPDDYSEVIQVGSFFYIVQLVERDEERKLEEEQRQLVARRDMTAWLAELTVQLNYERSLSEDDALKALEDVI